MSSDDYVAYESTWIDVIQCKLTEDKVSLRQLWFIFVTSLRSLVVLRDIFYVIYSIKTFAYDFSNLKRKGGHQPCCRHWLLNDSSIIEVWFFETNSDILSALTEAIT